jgi:hypothetical protein
MRVTSPTRYVGILVFVVATGLLSGSPAQAATPQGPGTYYGKAFDICAAPSQSTMDAWNASSPFGAIGIYISGNSRACGGGANLTPSWVQMNADRGWRFLPLHVGYQSPCYTGNKKKMSSDVSTAREQARSDANEAVAALRNFGFGPGSASYLDIEAYGRTTSCDNAVYAFMDVWTETLHASGFVSGVYSSGYSAIALINTAVLNGRSGFDAPDHVWFADTKGNVANTDAVGSYLDDSIYTNHQRIHQYKNGSQETFGGKTLTIDWDFVDIAATSTTAKLSRKMRLIQVTAGSTPILRRGSSGEAVVRVQKAMRITGRKIKVTGFFNKSTGKAVRSYRDAIGLKPRPVVNLRTWAALQSGKLR